MSVNAYRIIVVVPEKRGFCLSELQKESSKYLGNYFEKCGLKMVNIRGSLKIPRCLTCAVNDKEEKIWFVDVVWDIRSGIPCFNA